MNNMDTSTPVKEISRYKVFADVLRTVSRLWEIIDLMKRKHRKLLSFRVMSKKLWWYSVRSCEKAIKTLLLLWAPVYRHPVHWRQVFDKDYELSITPTMTKVLLNNLDAQDNKPINKI